MSGAFGAGLRGPAGASGPAGPATLSAEVLVNRGLHESWTALAVTGWGTAATGLPVSVAATADDATAVLDIPNGAVLTGAVIDYAGAEEGRAALPARVPRLSLLKQLISTFDETVLDFEDDASATVEVFEARHTIALTLGSPETVNRITHRYLFRVRGEADGGANAYAGGVVLLATLTYTLPNGTTISKLLGGAA